jgi:very-short-patch-repair endonuclease
MLQGGETRTIRAKALRQDMSLPEILLWQALRKQPSGLKFRRQHPSGSYVADFYCHEARLIVEVDGEAHNRGAAPRDDERRDAWFAERGLSVLRIPASEILRDLNDAVAGITAAARTS